MSYPTGKVNIKTYHGKFWCCRQDGSVVGEAETPREWEMWDVIPAGEGVVNLRSYHGGYLSCDQQGIVSGNKNQASNWETFQVMQCGNGFSFGTIHGTFICTDQSAQINGSARQAREWETYFLMPVGQSSGNQSNNFGNNGQQSNSGRNDNNQYNNNNQNYNNQDWNNNNNNNNQGNYNSSSQQQQQQQPAKKHRGGLEGFLLGAVDKIVDSPVGRTSANTILSETKIGEGLKEALRVGVQKAINTLSKTDGFYLDRVVKILLPDSMQGVARTISKIGLFADEVENFIKSMNRSAEAAAGRAMDIFMNSLFNMTLRDVRDILMGQDETAATNYFKGNCQGQINQTFRPIIQQTMQENRVLHLYNEIMAKIGGGNELLSFLGQQIGGQIGDIENWVLQKANDGLFFFIGNAEKEIRRNPAARVTDLLKDVFGNLKKDIGL